MEHPPPLISIIMINRNGGDYLAPALSTCRAAIEAALPIQPRIEFVLVDNGSTDHPGAVIDRCLLDAPFSWRVVDEPSAGVNHARNAGIAAAHSDLLFFVDSDLEFHPDWMRAIVTAMAEHPGARIIGGRLRVGKIEAAVPEWLAIDGPFARRSIVVTCDFGDSTVELPLDDSHGPVGPNMGFRRDVFKDFGEFDTRFGLRPGSLIPGAESEFFDRLSRAGMRFLYVPDAIVNHPLRKSQMTKMYFQKRLRGIGRATSRLRRLRGEKARQVCGLTLYAVRLLVENATRWLRAWVTFASPAERFHARGNVDVMIGFLQEDWAAWRFGVAAATVPLPGDLEVSKRRTLNPGQR